MCTYFLNRPCVYCTLLLLILFTSSCHWSDHCFFDASANWFEPRPLPAADTAAHTNATAGLAAEVLAEAVNGTAKTVGGAVLQEIHKSLPVRPEWTGLGLGWLRSSLGRREWTLPCVDVNVRL